MGEERKAVLYSLSYAIPMLSILETKEQNDIKKIIRRLNSYKKIYVYLGARATFDKITANLYSQIKAGRRPRDLPVESVEKKLRDTLRRLFFSAINELRDEGYGRGSDKIEEFVNRGEFKNAYLTLKEIREKETGSATVENLLDRVDSIMRKLTAMSKVGLDVSEITRRVSELLGVVRIKLPNKKMVLINDETGNSGCLISAYLDRMNVEHVTISSKSIGDYWITKIDAKKAVSPQLQLGSLVEAIVKSDKLVILEDINYLITVNSFGEVYKFLQYVKNKAPAKLLVTGNFKMLNEREIARLRGLFDSTITLSTLFNFCSWGMVGIRERRNKGALLLSKELVDNFEGNVVMVADFGGDKYLHPQRLNFEISDVISRHLKEGSVIIDSLDLLIDENGLEKIYEWLKSVRDVAISNGNVVYITLNNIISKEREYLRALFDIDIFYLSTIDGRVLGVVSKQLKQIENTVNKSIEKECAYNIEVIRRKYERYRKYLTEVKDDMEKLQNAGATYNIDFLLKTTPLRLKVEALVEVIEQKSTAFHELREALEKEFKIAEEYVDVDDPKYYLNTAVDTFESGDIDRALEKIKVSKSKMDQIMSIVIKKAEALRKELECIEYLLPAYFQSKLRNYSNGIDDIAGYTALYRELKRVIFDKIRSEYGKLKKYSAISGIPLPNLDSAIERMRFCEYRKERDQFMEQFESNKEHMVEIMQKNAFKIIEFLEGSGYTVPVSKRRIKTVTDFDELFGMIERLYNHFTMVISKSIDNLKEKYPEYMKKHSAEAERIIVDASVDPIEAIARYQLFVGMLKREIGEQKAKMFEIKKKLEEYYSLFKKAGLHFEEWYPKSVSEGEVIVKFLESLFGEISPDIDVDLTEISTDKELNAHLSLVLKNIGNYEAKNISIEFSGAVSYQEKIDYIAPGGAVEININAKVTNPNENINVDLFFENFNGEIKSKSFTFEVNLRGYTTTIATGAEKCALCRGKIFKDTEMVVCSECGATYHPKCAERLQKCKICGNVFIF